MKNPCEKALNTLLADCRSLADRARRVTRNRPASDELLDDLRRAVGHVALAMDALDTRSAGSPARSLSSRASRLAGALARGGAKEPTRMADAIATLRSTRPETARHDLEGSTGSIPIPELLGFLNVQGKTGTLRVRLEHEQISISLRSGELVYARSDNSPRGSRLGEILVRQGAIRGEQLESFLVFHAARDGQLGKALEVGDLVTEEQLQAALDQQIHELLARLFDAREARFTFRDGEIEAGAEDYGRNVVQLLLEGARLHDTSLRDADPEDEGAAAPAAPAAEAGPTAGGAPGELRLGAPAPPRRDGSGRRLGR